MILAHTKIAALQCDSRTKINITCKFGQLEPTPNCLQNSKIKFLKLLSNVEFLGSSSCLAPRNGIDPVLIYFNNSNESIELDRQQNSYPNNTILHYACEGGSPTEASAIKCLNGEWTSLLLPCGKLDPTLKLILVI